jgi:hypothetical protein
MTSMRALPVVIVALLLFLAVSTFLIYGGQAAVHPDRPAPAIRPSGSGERYEPPPPRDFGPEIQALSKRVDDLAEQVARLQAGNDRSPVAPAPPLDAGDHDFAHEHRDDVLRLIQEERDLEAMPAQIDSLRQAVGMCCIYDGYPDGKPAGDSTDVLIEVEKRYREIRRRILPADSLVKPTDAQKAQYAKEIEDLREWRRTELARIAGADAAQKLIGTLGRTQPLPSTLP